MTEKGNRLDIISRAWSRTWELLAESRAVALTAIGIFLVSAIIVHRMRGAEAARDWAIDTIVGLIATVVVGIFVFLVNLFVVIPQEERKELTSLKSQNENLLAQDKALQIDLASIRHDHEIASNKLDTLALATGNTAAGGLNEKLDKFLKDFQDTMQTVSNLKQSVKNPFDEPIASANATVVIDVLTNYPTQTGVNITEGGLVSLYSGNEQKNNQMLFASTTSHLSIETEVGQRRYKIVAQASVDDPCMGQPIKALGGASLIQIEFCPPMVQPGTPILGGKVIWVINNSIHLKFDIPKQIAGRDRTMSTILIADLAETLKPLREAP